MGDSKEVYVIVYVEVPEGQDVDDLRQARLLVPGWPDFGFRAEVISVGKP